MSQHNSADPICCVTFRDANVYRGCSGRRHKSFHSNSHLAQSVWGKPEKSQNAKPHSTLVSFQPTKAHLVRVAHAHAMHPFLDNHFARKFVLRSPGGVCNHVFRFQFPFHLPKFLVFGFGFSYASLTSAMPCTVSRFSLDRPTGLAQNDWPTNQTRVVSLHHVALS